GSWRRRKRWKSCCNAARSGPARSAGRSSPKFASESACARSRASARTMIVWIDADACPAPIKEIVFRAAERLAIETVVVANHAVRVPRSPHVRALLVPSGFDVADARILEELGVGDLVVT